MLVIMLITIITVVTRIQEAGAAAEPAAEQGAEPGRDEALLLGSVRELRNSVGSRAEENREAEGSLPLHVTH